MSLCYRMVAKTKTFCNINFSTESIISELSHRNISIFIRINLYQKFTWHSVLYNSTDLSYYWRITARIRKQGQTQKRMPKSRTQRSSRSLPCYGSWCLCLYLYNLVLHPQDLEPCISGVGKKNN